MNYIHRLHILIEPCLAIILILLDKIDYNQHINQPKILLIRD